MLFNYPSPINPVVLFGRGGDEGLRREPRGVGRAGQPHGAPVPAETHVVNSGLSSKARHSCSEIDIRTGCSSEEDCMWRGNIVNVESLNLFHYFLMMSHYPLSLYNLVYAKTTKYMLAKLIT